MSVGQALGQVGPPRNELGDHVVGAGREEGIQGQNHTPPNVKVVGPANARRT